MADPERKTSPESGQNKKELAVSRELLALCQNRYTQWTEELISPNYEESLPPTLFTAGFYRELAGRINPDIRKEAMTRPEMEEEVNSLPSVPEKNAAKEAVIREITGGDPLAAIKNEKARLRVRSAVFDILVAFSKMKEGEHDSLLLEDKLAPRAWLWVKNCDLEDLADISHITHLEPEEGIKPARLSPRTLALSVEILSH